MPRLWRIFPILVLLTATSGAAQAYEEGVERYALVVGNSAYHFAPLKNAGNDARAVSASLENIGFEVTTILDSNLQQLRQGVTAFYEDIASRHQEGALVLFYYAGHAVQISHGNYLVPLEPNLSDTDSLLEELYDTSELFELIGQFRDIQNIIILDACRNNPFAGMALGETAVGDGLAPIRAPVNTLIAYATEPDGVASDGRGENSIYTRHLLRHIDKKIDVEEVFKKVRRGVARETRNLQIPWEHSSLVEGVYINPPKNREVPDLMSF